MGVEEMEDRKNYYPVPSKILAKQNAELSDYSFLACGRNCTNALSSLKYCNYGFILNGDRKLEWMEIWESGFQITETVVDALLGRVSTFRIAKNRVDDNFLAHMA